MIAKREGIAINSDALHLVHNRGKLMQSAVPLGKGAMLAVMGLKMEELQ